jgi:hypothetical protein
MKQKSIFLVLFFGVLIFLSEIASASDIWVWTPPSPNENALGTLPTDFPLLFTKPVQWKKTLNRIDTYAFSVYPPTTDVVWQDDFLTNKVIPLFASHNIAIAIDSGKATWYTCRKAQGDRNIEAELNDIRHFYSLGGKISYIWMQSSLTKNVPDQLVHNCPDYDIDQRIADIVHYIKTIHAEFPDIKIGLIDNPAGHILANLRGTGDPIETVYQKLISQLQANGETLAFIIDDSSSENLDGSILPGIKEYPQTIELENFVRNELKLPFGLILRSDEEGISETEYAQKLIHEVKQYKNHGGNPDFYLFTNNKGNVSKLLPENATEGYPATRYILEIAKLVKNTVTLPGDVNSDNEVNIEDLMLLKTDFGKASGFNANADLNKDNKIDLRDLVMLAKLI